MNALKPSSLVHYHKYAFHIPRVSPVRIGRLSFSAPIYKRSYRYAHTSSPSSRFNMASNQQQVRHRHDSPPQASEHSHEHSHEQPEHTHEHSHESQESHESHEDHFHSHGGMSMLTHSHSHGQPNELLSSSFSNPAVRITWIGLIVNIGLAISKGVGGVYFHSQSLIADAIHSVSDMVADFLTLATVNVASKIGNPDNFPLGYGKIESVGSLLVSGVLLFAGVSVGWSSLLQVFEYTLPGYMFDYVSKVQIGHSHSHSDLLGGSEHTSNGHSHSHSSEAQLANNNLTSAQTPQIPNINAAWLAGASIIVKELLYQRTMKVANQMNSKVLVANAWHHRVDSLTAFVAVVTVTGGVMFNIAWLDSVGGLLVSALIIKAGWGSFKNAIFELIDKGESKVSDESTKIKSIIQDNIGEERFKVLNLSVLPSGANTNIFITLVGSDSTNESIKELNALEQKISGAIKSNDHFVRNVFVQFKKINGLKYERLADKDINEEL